MQMINLLTAIVIYIRQVFFLQDFNTKYKKKSICSNTKQLQKKKSKLRLFNRVESTKMIMTIQRSQIF